MRLKCNLSSAFSAGNIQNRFKAQMSSYSDFYIGFSKHKTHKVGGILWSWCKHLGPFSFHWCEICKDPSKKITTLKNWCHSLPVWEVVKWTDFLLFIATENFTTDCDCDNGVTRSVWHFTCRQQVRLRITGNNHPVNVEWSEGDKN